MPNLIKYRYKNFKTQKMAIHVQLNLSNPTHQGTGKICRIVQDVGILRFYFC